MSLIKTPDQKLRVFISSTIQELAEERKLAREAISKLRLTPVLFEMGARPHPPRELYRAYLEQSHIFVGCYWNSYGWIAPDMEISGLEDEFLLSEGKPRLIYVKKTDTPRHPRLKTLLLKIQQSDSVSYQAFSTAQELQELLENDLSVLLSERFESAENEDAPHHVIHEGPVIRSKIVGREEELEALQKMILQPETGLLTITGAGGTGKTRLALQFIHEVKEHYKNGVCFVSLAAITDVNLVAATIAHELGLFDSGHQPIKETMIQYLQDKELLLVLDNFEQITEAGLLVNEIVQSCPSVKILVTSRTPLHLRSEHIFPLSTLSNPDQQKIIPSSELLSYPSVQLFIQRAKEVNPGLVLDEYNLKAISVICNRLDGLPLAIELAAARTKYLTPVDLAGRMGKMLDVLSNGPRDLPQRQQTLRATIEWSCNLLDETCRWFFWRLACFNDGWTLEASDSIANPGKEMDILELTEKLLDLGLVRSTSHELEKGSIVMRFNMLQTIKEYTTEMLEKNQQLQEVKKQHAEYYVCLANKIGPHLWSANPVSWMKQVELEYQNISAAFLNSAALEDFGNCCDIVSALVQFWVMKGRYSEAFQWMDMAHITAEGNHHLPASMAPECKAGAFLAAGILKYFSGEYKQSIEFLNLSVEIYQSLNNLKGVARAKSYIGIAGLTTGDYTAGKNLQEAIELGHQTKDILSTISASTFLTEVYIVSGEKEKAKVLLDKTEELAIESGSTTGLAIVSLQKGNFYYPEDEFERSAAYFTKSIQLFDEAGFNSVIGWAYMGLGSCETELHQFAAAKINLEKGLEHARERGEKTMILLALICFAGLAAESGDPVKGARLMGAVDMLKEKVIGYRSWSSNRKATDMAVKAIRNGMTEEEKNAQMKIGSSYTLEQAMALAVE